MFDIKRYKNKRFHEKDSVNKKIEALFLLYDKRVNEMNLDYRGRIKLINIFIEDLIRFEEYEVVQAFKDRKFLMWKNWRNRNRKMTVKLRYRLIKFRITKKIINTFCR